MRTSLTSITILCLMLSASSFQAQESRTFMISYGLTETEPQDWSGNLSIENGTLVNITGYRFGTMDQAITAGKWTSRTMQSRIPRGDSYIPLWYSPVTRNTPVDWSSSNFPPEQIMKAILSRVDGADATRLGITTNHGEVSVRLSELPWGERRDYLNGNLTVQRTLTESQITTASDYNDNPAIGIDNQGTTWTAWAAFDPETETDQIVAMSIKDNRRGALTNVSDRPGEYHTVKIARDGQGRLWFVWSGGIDANYELFARYYIYGEWSDVQRLTQRWNGDGFHQMTTGPDGRIWMVWQSLANNNSDIMMMICDNGNWSEPIAVADSPANEWEPQIAVDSKGTAWIAWDVYRNGNYDVALRSYTDGTFSDVIPVTNSPDFEARVSMVIDKADRLWLAWDHGDERWGKDNPGGSHLTSGGWNSKFKGMKMRENNQVPWQAGGLRRTEYIDVQVYQDGQFYQTANPLPANFHADLLDFYEFPNLSVDAQGNVWLFFRHVRPIVGKSESERNGWTLHATYFNGEEWTPPVVLPRSSGRNHQRMVAGNDADGNLQLVWPTDTRGEMQRYTVKLNETVIDRRDILFAGSLMPPATVSLQPKLERMPLPGKPAVPRRQKRFLTDRHGPIRYQGEEYRVYWGDLHRHTDISNDGGQDGSLVDMFRWCLDAGDTDFGAVTDHSPNLQSWWRTQKMTDMFHMPNSFVSLYMYERSRNWPWGHRNVLNLNKGIKVHPTVSINGNRPRNEVEYFWQSVKDEEIISIPHTTASSMGTQFLYNDEQIERVVEIFQGDRLSYEHVGAPKTDPSVERYKEGTIWNALAKGYKFGFIAASDHQSTHLSYGAVLSTELSREGIYRSISDRRTYAATDTILVDMRVNGHMMGEDFTTSKAPTIQVNLTGTDVITKVWIIKDNSFLYTLEPNTGTVNFSYTDKAVTPGDHYYYVRVQQADEAMAWGSPVFVTYREE
jgi:hypothetical protein